MKTGFFAETKVTIKAETQARDSAYFMNQAKFLADSNKKEPIMQGDEAKAEA